MTNCGANEDVFIDLAFKVMVAKELVDALDTVNWINELFSQHLELVFPNRS